MSKKSHPNPHYTAAWTLDIQGNYLKTAYEYYCKERGNPIVNEYSWYRSDAPKEPSKKPYHPTLTFLYHWGMINGYLRISYSEFVIAVTTHDHPYPIKHTHWSRRRREYVADDAPYTDFWKAEYREKIKYVKKAHHKKKERTEEDQYKADWRAKKGFDKHRANPYWSTGKKWAKQVSNQTHRTWERNVISREAWDEFDKDRSSYKWFFDPWMWD